MLMIILWAAARAGQIELVTVLLIFAFAFTLVTAWIMSKTKR